MGLTVVATVLANDKRPSVGTTGPVKRSYTAKSQTVDYTELRGLDYKELHIVDYTELQKGA